MFQILVRFLFYLSGRLFFRYKINWIGKIPKKKGIVIIANHVSWVDSSALTGFIPRIYTRFVLIEDFYNKFRWFFKGIRAIPIKDDNISKTEYLNFVKTVREKLSKRETICIFPEAEMSRIGTLQALKKGIFTITRKTDFLTIPVHMENLTGAPFTFKPNCFNETFPFSLKRLKHKIYITVGNSLPKNVTAFQARSYLNGLAGENLYAMIPDRLNVCKLLRCPKKVNMLFKNSFDSEISMAEYLLQEQPGQPFNETMFDADFDNKHCIGIFSKSAKNVSKMAMFFALMNKPFLYVSNEVEVYWEKFISHANVNTVVVGDDADQHYFQMLLGVNRNDIKTTKFNEMWKEGEKIRKTTGRKYRKNDTLFYFGTLFSDKPFLFRYAHYNVISSILSVNKLTCLYKNVSYTDLVLKSSIDVSFSFWLGVICKKRIEIHQKSQFFVALSCNDVKGKDITGKEVVQRAQKDGSEGKILPGLYYKVIDPQSNKELSEGQEGEIWIKGKALPEIFDIAGNSVTKDSGGWVNCGIFGHIDSEGFLFIS